MLTTLLYFGSLMPVYAGQEASLEAIRAAATRSITVLQRGSAGFDKQQQCFSCHNHALPAVAFESARAHGIPVDETLARAGIVNGLTHFLDLTSIDPIVQGHSLIDPGINGWTLIGAHAAGVASSLTTGVLARQIANWQEQDGSWVTVDQRPPNSHSQFTTTAVSLRALQFYMPPELHEETLKRVGRAKDWLVRAKPVTTEDYTYKLIGLIWAGAPREYQAAAATELIKLQRANGGWAQLPQMEPDAYATGEALVALFRSGAARRDPNMSRGIAFLLSTQAQDGSWNVRTRMVSPAPVSPPYFETGFPYGKDQFISTSATALAASALMEALPRTRQPTHPETGPELNPKGEQPWMRTALFGTAADVASLLEHGLDPNSATADGTTLLMMAAEDSVKVRLLLDRGANANAKAKSGFTAIMVASIFRGTAASLKALIDKGAEARPGTGVKFNGSPLIFASWARDTDNIALLLTKGADPNRKFLAAGTDMVSPLLIASLYGDAGATRKLANAGADVSEKDGNGMTPLHWAVLADRVDSAKALIASGVPVNATDKWGYTSLHYAATIYFGGTEMVSALRQAGADMTIRNKEGKTPLEQARKYHHRLIEAALHQ